MKHVKFYLVIVMLMLTSACNGAHCMAVGSVDAHGGGVI
jgi:hypothetical protein